MELWKFDVTDEEMPASVRRRALSGRPAKKIAGFLVLRDEGKTLCARTYGGKNSEENVRRKILRTFGATEERDLPADMNHF